VNGLAAVGCLVAAVEGVPDKKALAAPQDARRKFDELYREVTSRKTGAAEPPAAQ
jgi:hypothetical protein